MTVTESQGEDIFYVTNTKTKLSSKLCFYGKENDGCSVFILSTNMSRCS